MCHYEDQIKADLRYQRSNDCQNEIARAIRNWRDAARGLDGFEIRVNVDRTASGKTSWVTGAHIILGYESTIHYATWNELAHILDAEAMTIRAMKVAKEVAR